MADRACAAKNKAGEPCKVAPLTGSDYCRAHDPQLPESSRFGSHAQATAAGNLGGRPKQPRVVDVIREKIEAEVDEWLGVLAEARDAQEAVSVGFGKDAYLEMVPDHKTRLRALDMVLDRAYGKPKQQTEISGPDGGPVELIAPVDAEAKSARAARLLHERGLVDGDA